MSDFKLPPPGFDTQALAQAGGFPRRNASGGNVDPQQLDKSAQDFEAVFISQMLSHMWQGVETDSTFGGGQAEDTWRGMMVEEYGKQVARAGGLGIADEIKREMLRMQEDAQKKEGA